MTSHFTMHQLLLSSALMLVAAPAWATCWVGLETGVVNMAEDVNMASILWEVPGVTASTPINYCPPKACINGAWQYATDSGWPVLCTTDATQASTLYINGASVAHWTSAQSILNGGSGPAYPVARNVMCLPSGTGGGGSGTP